MSDLSAGELVGDLSAPTLDRQGDAESRDDRISDEAVEAAMDVIEKRHTVYGISPFAGDDGGRAADYEADMRAVLAAAVPHLERQIRESIAGDETVKELRELWQRALEREGNLASAVADVMWKATQFGETEDGDTAAYLVPKGAMHRLIGVAQQNGAHVPVSFRASTPKVSS